MSDFKVAFLRDSNVLYQNFAVHIQMLEISKDYVNNVIFKKKMPLDL